MSRTLSTAELLTAIENALRLTHFETSDDYVSVYTEFKGDRSLVIRSNEWSDQAFLITAQEA